MGYTNQSHVVSGYASVLQSPETCGLHLDYFDLQVSAAQRYIVLMANLPPDIF